MYVNDESVNSYWVLVLTFPQVAIVPEPKGAIVYKKVWNSKRAQDELKKWKGLWLHDGRKLAW